MDTPLIAITTDFKQQKYELKNEYVTAVYAAGGLPILLPYTSEASMVQCMLTCANGILLSGGSDIDPYLYREEPAPTLETINPERDAFEVTLIQAALDQGIPILAVCRGNLMLNVAAGGTLYQDIYSENEASIQHYQAAPRDHVSHSVQVKSHTRLHRITGTDIIRVNSYHHQAIKTLAPGFQSSARSSDSIIEAIEDPHQSFVVGVQWHPGSLIQKQSHALNLFKAFITAAKTYAHKNH
ncbi:gamma-glutamyl hydrolase [Pullulanibacillus camelliae]|uniref:Gamma-glutamyl hydrolase n=1 Tax=Pullulanibacillus camelliae TaxID=1707096 RepID=A0A8J2VMU0_9BACL|nr:gamma-glutamyl-gamma-aminobutyrate hydrolase family protein [Pullulanibacillus camelliae]GGE33347.1 gamma-glutamyl hydrolase [Pullulanibacillus camelliae]